MELWSFGMFALNVLVMVMLVPQLLNAPCWLQTVTAWLFAISLVLYILGFVLPRALSWNAEWLAQVLEHFGVLLFCARLHLQKHEQAHKDEAEWKPYSVASRSL